MPYAIMRFMRHKNQGIKGIQDHNERLKDDYKSNDKIDNSRTHLNFHTVKPQTNYREEIGGRIAAAGCRTRKDSVKMVETLMTCSPEFFEGKAPAEVREFFMLATEFIQKEVGGGNVFSAVVHLDEETPHMHLMFTPITEDKHLCAKEILGNRKKLVEWQDKYFEYMSARYPELNRGVAAEVTGRKHIPIQLFKQSVRLDKEMEEIQKELENINPINANRKKDIVIDKLMRWFPSAEEFSTQVQKLEKELNAAHSANLELGENLNQADDKYYDTLMRLKVLENENRKYKKFIDKLPPELAEEVRQKKKNTHEKFKL